MWTKKGSSNKCKKPEMNKWTKYQKNSHKEGGPIEEGLLLCALGEAAAAQEAWVGLVPAQEPKTTS